MLVVTQIEPRFVKGVPRELDCGVLYVSMEYGTVVHSCCCGCGNEVVTPLAPAEWHLNFDGETVSLWPSVGNWNLPCHSHYVIRRNRILACDDWSDEKIAHAQKRDATSRRDFYRRQHEQHERVADALGEDAAHGSKKVNCGSRTEAAFIARPGGFWSRLVDRWRRS